MKKKITFIARLENYYYLDETLYYYLRHSNSTMSLKDNSPKVLDILFIENEIYNIVKKYKNIEDYKAYLTQNYIDMVNYLYKIMPKKYHKEALKRIKYYYKNINSDKKIFILYIKRKYIKIRKFIKKFFSIKDSEDKKSVVITIMKVKLNIPVKKQK